MNARRVRARGTLAIAHAMSQAVYDGLDCVGHVYRVERGYLAEDAEGQLIGTFPSDRLAARAVCNTARRPS